MDMGAHIETIMMILVLRNARATLAHFKVIQKTLKIAPMRLDETQRETINHWIVLIMALCL